VDKFEQKLIFFLLIFIFGIQIYGISFFLYGTQHTSHQEEKVYFGERKIVFKNNAEGWQWVAYAKNGRAVAYSKSYTTKGSAKQAVKREYQGFKLKFESN